MFLWWLQNKQESPRSRCRDPPKKLTFQQPSSDGMPEPSPLDRLLGLFWGQMAVDDEELLEVEQQEIDELESTLSQAALYRRSNVSKAKYSEFQRVESKQHVGESVRQESEQRRRQRAAFLEAHKLAGCERAQRSRAQRELALERVRHHREANARRGQRAKGENDERLAELERQRVSWREQGAQTAGREGRLEHLRRLQDSKDELRAGRLAAALEVKRDRGQRQQAEREAAGEAMEANRQKVDRVREDTKSDVAIAAADTFYRARGATADGVRDAVGGWRTERVARQNSFMAAARARHESLREVRRSHSDEEVVRARKHDADAMRLSLAHIEARDKMQRLADEVERRGRHDDAYEAKFVGVEEAARVEEHPHTALANAHRDPRTSGAAAIHQWIDYAPLAMPTPAGTTREEAVPGASRTRGKATSGGAAAAVGEQAGAPETSLPGAAYEGVAHHQSTPISGRPKWKLSVRSSGWFSSR